MRPPPSNREITPLDLTQAVTLRAQLPFVRQKKTPAIAGVFREAEEALKTSAALARRVADGHRTYAGTSAHRQRLDVAGA